jgi:hypothetical protein
MKGDNPKTTTAFLCSFLLFHEMRHAGACAESTKNAPEINQTQA